jgi:cytochrome c oxidase subunit 5a
MGRRAMADDPHENETFEEFTARYENEFESVNDVFELQVRFFFSPVQSQNPMLTGGEAQPEQRLCVRSGAVRVRGCGGAAGLSPRQRLPHCGSHARRYALRFFLGPRLTLVGLREKVENESQYNEYLRELEPLREELGISLKEAMYPDNKKW